MIEPKLPSYMTRDIVFTQLAFGLPLSGALACLIGLSYIHRYLDVPVAVFLSCVALTVVVWTLRYVRILTLFKHCAVEMQRQITFLSILDEGFEEYWEKYLDKGFSKEELDKIQLILRSKNGTSTKENFD